MADEKQLYNVSLEQEVLAILMCQYGKNNITIDRVQKDIFYREAHKVIFDVISDIANAGATPDTLTVTDRLTQIGKLQDVGGMEFLVSLMNRGNFTANFSSYLEKLREYAELRTLRRMAVEVLATINDNTEDRTAGEIKELFQDKLAHCKSLTPKDEYEKQNDLEALNSYFEKVFDENRGKCYPTGFAYLDRALSGGLYAGLYGIGAVSGLGKTTFTMQIACNIAKSGTDVLFFSLEMARDELMARNISRTTAEMSAKRFGDAGRLGKTNLDVMSGSRYRMFTQDEQDFIMQAVDEYSKYAEHIYSVEGNFDITIESIKQRISKHIEATGNKPVVIIDYLQILGVEAERNGKSITDKQKADRIISYLKRTSRDLDIPIMVVSSFNREAYNSPVSMSSFKESGKLYCHAC